jgi:hypothetical protein
MLFRLKPGYWQWETVTEAIKPGSGVNLLTVIATASGQGVPLSEPHLQVEVVIASGLRVSFPKLYLQTER